ncbi:hypothetical protein ABEV54_15705 [Peribacillus psychrosaccharolyticus]|uniref:DoxX family protein n=1 Tax=Peribacillus psychrosaccharolyticus TaxID=1407 RepID=UPI003D2D74C6
MSNSSASLPRKFGLIVFSFVFIAAGIYHFTEAEGFTAMLPDFIPWRAAIIYLTGVIEGILAIFLFIPSIRHKTGVVIAWYLVLIFPANIYAAFASIPAPGFESSPPWALWVRLIFQPLLICWILWATKLPYRANNGYVLSNDLQNKLKH